jgi:phosphatidylinositol alpha-1,6-mannosyltransferase
MSNAQCIVYLHGLDIDTDHRLYRLIWHPVLRHFDRVLANSHFTATLARKARIPVNRLHILHPGVWIPDLSQAATQGDVFRRQHDLDEAPVLLYVGRITARKGLARFIENSLPEIITSKPRARLVVIGEEPHESILGTSGERARIDRALSANGLSQHVLFLGALAQDDPQLSAAYSGADVLVFPVQERAHDNEGFGMVAVEAAAHGLPTVAFAVGGVPDAIADGISGDLVEPNDYAAFSGAVLSRLKVTSRARIETAERATAFARGFSWPLFGQRLRELTGLDHDLST